MKKELGNLLLCVDLFLGAAKAVDLGYDYLAKADRSLKADETEQIIEIDSCYEARIDYSYQNFKQSNTL